MNFDKDLEKKLIKLEYEMIDRRDYKILKRYAQERRLAEDISLMRLKKVYDKYRKIYKL